MNRTLVARHETRGEMRAMRRRDHPVEANGLRAEQEWTDTRRARIGFGRAAALAVAILCLAGPSQADEQLWAFARGTETLPEGKAEAYQFLTLRTGKKHGDYYGVDSDTEVEYGFTNEIQASLAVVNHYFYVKDVEELRDSDRFRFGGVEASVKGRVLSPFIDPIGLSFRFETGYLAKDDVGGIRQQEWFLAPEVAVQKNFRDDTISWVLDGGFEFAWGKQPAEEYPRELSVLGATGLAWRFAPNWFLGAETKVRAEYPLFNFHHFEHVAIYSGPSLHYGGERWWMTASWLYQAWGRGIGEPNQQQTFAEETKQIARIKVGLNF